MCLEAGAKKKKERKKEKIPAEKKWDFLQRVKSEILLTPRRRVLKGQRENAGDLFENVCQW